MNALCLENATKTGNVAKKSISPAVTDLMVLCGKFGSLGDLLILEVIVPMDVQDCPLAYAYSLVDLEKCSCAYP